MDNCRFDLDLTDIKRVSSGYGLSLQGPYAHESIRKEMRLEKHQKGQIMVHLQVHRI